MHAQPSSLNACVYLNYVIINNIVSVHAQRYRGASENTLENIKML